MTLEEYDLKDPQRLLDEIAGRRPLCEGDVLLVLVHQPATRQQILDIRRLPVAGEPDAPPDPDSLDDARGANARHQRSRLLYDVMHTLAIPPREAGSRSVVVTVIVRRGRNLWGPTEKLWAAAWRYSNHLTEAFDTDILVVTEHGWASLQQQDGGASPRLELGADHQAQGRGPCAQLLDLTGPVTDA